MELDFVRDFTMSGVDLMMNDATIHTITLKDNGYGTLREVPDQYPARAREDSVLEWMRLDDGYTEDNVGIFVLQQNGLTLKKDDKVMLARMYVIENLRQDPLKIAWECRAKPFHG